MNRKIDFKKSLKQLYNPPRVGFHIVEVPEMYYVMMEGEGNPNTSVLYQQAVEALYTMSYGIKFAFKSQGFDYIIPPLEGLWWMENMSEFSQTNKDYWKWNMMIMQPEWVTPELVEKIRGEGLKKKGNPLLIKVNFRAYQEGLTVQTLYFGAYENEAQTIAEMHNFIKFSGYQTNGKHHEIYLSDPRKTPPDRLRTILRQPVRIG